MKPIILVGNGARDSIDRVLEFAEKNSIPLMTTWNAVDLVPYDNPLFLGRPGIVATRGANMAIQSCDYLLALGARVDESIVAYNWDNFAPLAYKRLVDVDVASSLISRFDHFENKSISDFDFPVMSSTPEWLAQCQEWKQDRMEGDTTTYVFLELLNTLPEDEVIVAGSSCMAVSIVCAGFRSKKGQRFILSSCGLGSMGATLPVAIGAALATGKHVTLFDGEGSFMQNIQELEVVKRLNLPITFHIIENGGYASIHNSEMRAFDRSAMNDTIPDVKRVADAFGVEINIIHAPYNETQKPRVMKGGSLENMWPYETLQPTE